MSGNRGVGRKQPRRFAPVKIPFAPHRIFLNRRKHRSFLGTFAENQNLPFFKIDAIYRQRHQFRHPQTAGIHQRQHRFQPAVGKIRFLFRRQQQPFYFPRAQKLRQRFFLPGRQNARRRIRFDFVFRIEKLVKFFHRRKLARHASRRKSPAAEVTNKGGNVVFFGQRTVPAEKSQKLQHVTPVSGNRIRRRPLFGRDHVEKIFQPPVRHFLLPGKSVFDRLFDRFRRKRNLAGNYPQHQCRDNRGRRVKPNFSVAFLTHIFTFRKKNIDKI